MISKEQKIKVVPFMIRLFCNCGGKMIPEGIVLTVYPPLYPHKCERCGLTENTHNRYPYMSYEEAK